MCLASAIVVLMAQLALGTSAAAAEPLFSDGFESGDLSSWTASTGFAAQQDVVFSGLWAGRATSTGAGAYVYRTLASAQTDLYLDARFDLVSANGTASLLRFLAAKGKLFVSLDVNRSGKLSLRNGITRTTTTSATTVSKNTWHEAQLHASINGSSSLVEVWLDGVQVGDIGGPQSLGTKPIGRIQLGVSTKVAFDVAFDNVVADLTFVAPPTDTTAPDTPAGLTATKVSAYEVDLVWGASSDDVGVTGYTVYRDGVPVGTAPGTAFADRSVSPSTTYGYAVDAFDAAGNHSDPSAAIDVTTPAPPDTPIQHVVIIDQENHSFDDTLGRFCADIAVGSITGHDTCDGATEGTLSTGAVVPLSQEPDVVPDVAHWIKAQQTAIDGGRMDGFDKIPGCTPDTNYACYTQFDPSQIPNLAALATTYVVSDRTFEFATTPSWGGHMVLASATLDGFDGDNPHPSTFTSQTGPGWGCDSFRDDEWWDGTQWILEPSCIPDQNGNGPYRASPVSHVPTIFDRMDDASLTWKIYAGSGTHARPSYSWSICPTFYECLESQGGTNFIDASSVLTDAQDGHLPNLSIVTPTGDNSQHNLNSMAVGDNWIGQVVSAIQSGPDWSSTAIFITYDDCGCFYDHVPPPTAEAGVRVPMVIVSPYTKAGFTDSSIATYMSMLAFTEHNFGLAPLTAADANAYDYADSFDYTQTPQAAPVPMVTTHVSRRELAYIENHPPAENDPT